MVFYFFLMTFTYCMRSVLSVAIVAMNDPKTSINKDIEVYDWDNQSVVLSAFFWGYVLLQVPSAQLGKKFGAKWMLVGCTSLDSLSCILIPVMASRFGSTGVMICRVSQGLAQGGVAPLVHTLLGCWAPPSERSVMATVAYTGGTFGIILCLPITGVICSGYWGWPASFYLFGSLGLMWALAWSVFGADTPSTHKTISNIERKYIETSLGQIEYKVCGLNHSLKRIFSDTNMNIKKMDIYRVGHIKTGSFYFPRGFIISQPNSNFLASFHS
ncbi:unnamed protein product [Phaedon cochleariae]|uniref:Major facilitator superfamily (MFS) profile domain-containing protein n=1 Tax=Phaedon cochleariae TaxID=80249 RepID=A0A9P0GU23_PHACE|nr:unnamed protein product [Phaedon cochleariae]